MTRSRDLGWTDPEVLALALTGAVSLVVFLVTEKRVAAPVINLDLFRWPAFTLANLLTLRPTPPGSPSACWSPTMPRTSLATGGSWSACSSSRPR